MAWSVPPRLQAISPSTRAAHARSSLAGSRRPRSTCACFPPPPAGAAEEVETLAEAFGELERTDLELKRLALLDADIQLSVAHWAGVPGELRDLSTRLRIEAGKLAAPLAVTIGGARFEGEVAADGTTAPPRLRANLVARESPLGGLAELVFDAPYVAGRVRRFDITLEAAGNRPGELSATSRRGSRSRLRGSPTATTRAAGRWRCSSMRPR